MIGIVLLAACLALLQTPSNSKSAWFDSNPCRQTETHNYTFGHWTPYQRLFYVDHPKFKPKFMRVRKEILTYPVTGEQIGGVIGYIEVWDLNAKGSGGCAYLTYGGVGSTYVTFNLKSQRNKGMEFIVRIFGE